MTNAFKPRNVLVIGASRGIGLALTQLVADQYPESHVFATYRNESGCEELMSIPTNGRSGINAVPCDTTDDQSIQQLATYLHDFGAQLDLVIHCAGVLHGKNLTPEKSITQVNREMLRRSFETNAFGAILMARSLLPLMTRDREAHWAALSAMVGSIGDNRLGGWYSYRASKAALNQLLKTFAIEARRTHPLLSVSLVHPGTTDTDMSRPYQARVPTERLYSPGVSARRVLEVILQETPDSSGRFCQWNGETLPW